MARVVDRVQELVAPVVEALDLHLYDITQAGGVLRVAVQREGGVDLEAIAAATRAINRALDEADEAGQVVIDGRYTLEVSSPGLERPLRTVEHFRGALDGPVRVKTRVDVDGERRFGGELVEVDDDAITLRTSEGERRLAYDDIDSARTVFEWGPAPKPGKARDEKKAVR